MVLEDPSNAEDVDRIDTIESLENIASLQPGKNAQLAAKKISEKYKKIRKANKRKNKFELPGEIVRIETVETSQGDVKVPVFVEKPQSSVRAAKKITKKYDKLRSEKSKKLAQIKGIEIVEEEPPKKYTKSVGIAAKKISDRYKKLRRKKNIDIVEEIKDAASKKNA